MTKYVSIGCNGSLGYMFSLPLCIRFFHRVANYKPIAVLVADEAYWISNPLRLHVLQQLNNMNGDCLIEFVGLMDPKYQLSTIAQSCRQHACALPYLRDDDLMIPGDADLLPLNGHWHNQHNPDTLPIALYYCNGAEPDYMNKHHFPTCYTSMRVGLWRELMDVVPGTPINEAIQNTFDYSGFDDKTGMDVWFQDQVYASKVIAESKYFPSQVMFIERDGHPPKDRIDRGGDKKDAQGNYIASSWPDEPDISGKVDAHLPRLPYLDSYWPSVRRLIAQAIPDELDWADVYRNRFMELMP